VSFLETLSNNWNQGIKDFNAGRFWHAHDAWEQGWVQLPEPWKTYVQSLIQVAAVQVLHEKGRPEAARNQARSALFKFRNSVHTVAGQRIEIDGVEAALERYLAQAPSSDANGPTPISKLKAKWHVEQRPVL